MSKAGSIAAKGIGLITTAATAASGALLALESYTEEYRIAQGKLNTAFEAAGYGTEAANQAYIEFFKILGDTDTATEASQLLAKLAENEEDLSKWTKIAAGVNGTFGDSLPIEGLIEASNETAKVGTVTGVLADALNWAGINEDDFNARLAECTDESERNRLIMETLSATYDEASESFYRNNEALVTSREAQTKMDAALAKLGTTVSNVKSKITAQFLPSISNLAVAFSDLLSGTEGAESSFSSAIESLVSKASEKLPDFLNFGTQILTSIISGISNAIPSLVNQIPTIFNTILTTFLGLLPQFVEIGIQAISKLGSGISQSLPTLIPQIVSILTEFVSTLTDPDNLGMLIDAAIAIIISLAEGLINSLPELLAKAPVIIENLIQAIIENVPKLIKAAAQIVVELVKGIIENLPQIFESGSEIIFSLISGLLSLPGNLIQAAKDIILYLWDTIKNTDWIQLGKDIINAVIDGIKKLASNVINVGKNVVSWIKDGISQAWDSLVNWVSGLFDPLFSFGGDSQTESNSGVNGSHAGGLNYVPYNGYIAQLHQGEMVLTAGEAAAYRKESMVPTVINQYIQAVPMTPNELARQSVDAFDRLRWAY